MSRATLAALSLLVSLTCPLRAEEPARNSSKESQQGWRLAVQAWTFHRFTFSDTVAKAKALGVKYLEAVPRHPLSRQDGETLLSHESSLAVLAKARIILDEAGVEMVNYGVVDLGTDEAANRKVFDFAKVMRIQTIISEPEPQALELIDRLANEYGINVAIHNHPKPSRYWDPRTVLVALQGRSRRMGACADVGHWVRSGLDPVESLRLLEGRIISLHFKDLSEASPQAHDVPWGAGVSDADAMLRELARQQFQGVFSIEYEHNWDNSVPEIAKCVEYFMTKTR